jgi:hypothetical protein
VSTIHPDGAFRTDLAKPIAQRGKFAPSATKANSCSGVAAIVTF